MKQFFSNRKLPFYIYIAIIFSSLFCTVGYSALNASVQITGDLQIAATIRTGLEITYVALNEEASSSPMPLSAPKYSKEYVSSDHTTITNYAQFNFVAQSYNTHVYEITLYNYGGDGKKDLVIQDIYIDPEYDGPSIEFTYTGATINQRIGLLDEVVLTVTFTHPSNTAAGPVDLKLYIETGEYMEGILTKEDDYPTYFLNTAVSRVDIDQITFENHNDVPANAVVSWDVSEARDGSVMMWRLDTDNPLHFHIGSINGVVYANPDSSFLFYGCESLSTITNPNYFSTIGVTNMSYMFAYSYDLGITSSNPFWENFDTSQVTDMSYMFSNLNTISTFDFWNWSTGKLTNMEGMFEWCTALKEVDISVMTTSKVTNMSGLFWGCSSIENLDLNDLATESVTDMSDMFNSCTSLYSVDLYSCNLSKVTDMSYMFAECSNLGWVDLGATGSLKNTSYMFYYCSNIGSIYFADALTFDSVTSYADMFTGVYEEVQVTVASSAAATWMEARLAECGVTDGTVWT